MRSAFPGWYKPTDEDLRALWDEGLIVLDANVLLAPYRLSGQARTLLFNLVEAYREQIWIPYQAGLEYQRNRLTVVAAQRATYSEIRSQLDSAEATLLARRPDHPVLDPVEFRARVQRAVQGIERYLSLAEAGHPEILGSDQDQDVIRDKWDELLEGCIGERLVVDEKWRSMGEKRYDEKIPPGYEDAKRDKGTRLFGDLILWFEVLQHVKDRVANGKSPALMFVTDDAKEDWWRIADGQRLGPRPELVEEMAAAGGKPFWMYSVARFISTGAERLGWEVRPDVTADLAATATEGDDLAEEEPEQETPSQLEGETAGTEEAATEQEVTEAEPPAEGEQGTSAGAADSERENGGT
jgi:hypothetical protein